MCMSNNNCYNIFNFINIQCKAYNQFICYEWEKRLKNAKSILKCFANVPRNYLQNIQHWDVLQIINLCKIIKPLLLSVVFWMSALVFHVKWPQRTEDSENSRPESIGATEKIYGTFKLGIGWKIWYHVDSGLTTLESGLNKSCLKSKWCAKIYRYPG